MPYQIHDIRTTPPDAFPLYFLDANTLIYHLTPRRGLSDYGRSYADFIDGVMALHTSAAPVKPKFAWLSQSLSEVINRWLRIDMQTSGMSDFKRVYRSSARYQTTLTQLISDLVNYEPYVELMDDEFKSLDPFGYLLPALSPQVDFNDLYFAELMRRHNIAIVTHDGDFNFEDVPIVTCNARLLNL
jgi:predicted nucleic acid-binding protein